MLATRAHKLGECNSNVCPHSGGLQASDKPLTSHITDSRALTCPSTAELGWYRQVGGLLLDADGGVGVGANLGDAIWWTLVVLVLWGLPFGVIGAAGGATWFPRPETAPPSPQPEGRTQPWGLPASAGPRPGDRASKATKTRRPRRRAGCRARRRPGRRRRGGLPGRAGGPRGRLAPGWPACGAARGRGRWRPQTPGG